MFISLLVNAIVVTIVGLYMGNRTASASFLCPAAVLLLCRCFIVFYQIYAVNKMMMITDNELLIVSFFNVYSKKLTCATDLVYRSSEL